MNGLLGKKEKEEEEEEEERKKIRTNRKASPHFAEKPKIRTNRKAFPQLCGKAKNVFEILFAVPTALYTRTSQSPLASSVVKWLRCLH